MTALAAQSICDDDNKLDFYYMDSIMQITLKGHTKKVFKEANYDSK